MTRRARRLRMVVAAVLEFGFLVLMAFASHKSWGDMDAAVGWSWPGFVWALVFGLSAAIFVDCHQIARTDFKELRRIRHER